MMIKSSRKAVATFTLLLLSLSTFVGIIPTTAQTVPVSKVSPDLRQLAQDGRQVSVIVQPAVKWNPLLDSLLTNLGGVLVGTLQTLPLRIVSLPGNRIEELAASSEVRYVSPDRQVGMMGHVSNTTGADAIRNESQTSLLSLVKTSQLDGSGIGIAILDSGIDSAHKSFANSLGASRVVVSRDFTGENRVDDPFGHGTHVAALAAGNAQLNSGAYSGIANNAHLINLRVLDSQGLGRTSNLLKAIDWLLTNHKL